MRMNQEKDTSIYMDEYSYNRFLNDIEKLKEEKRITDLGRSEVHKGGTDAAWDNAEFLELEKNSDMLASEIKRRKSLKEKIIILDRQNTADIIDFEDIIRLNLSDEYGEDEIIGKLVGDAHHDESKEFIEIFRNGFIGSSIYGRKIGKKFLM